MDNDPIFSADEAREALAQKQRELQLQLDDDLRLVMSHVGRSKARVETTGPRRDVAV